MPDDTALSDSISDLAATEPGTAIVTGASSGFGAATAIALARSGFHVVLGARRLEPMQRTVEALRDAGLSAQALTLDVDSPDSIAAFCTAVPAARVLVNNAGGALGVDSIAEARVDLWERMFRTNVLGVLRMTRALLPALENSGNGHVVNVGSIAGFETYPGGGGYTASKHALRALTRTLRLELLGRPIRVTEIAPGLAETEFSVVRFEGDREKAAKVYEGVEPLVAEDIAECIRWAVSCPSHVNIDEIVVRPRDQATAAHLHRRAVE
jgi:NADP-dependent 3-hydroxy acid dehydrogenase YdfG